MIEEVDLECATCGTVVPHTGNGITAVCSACDTVTHPESPSVPRVRINDPCPKCAVDRRHLVHRCGLCLFCGENLDKQDHHDCDRRGQSSRDIVVARTRVAAERELRDVVARIERLTGKDFLLYVSRPGDGQIRYVFQDHIAIDPIEALIYAYRTYTYRILVASPTDNPTTDL